MVHNINQSSVLGFTVLVVSIALGIQSEALAGTTPTVTPVSYDNIFQSGTEFSVSVNGKSIPVYNAYNNSTDSAVVSYWGTFRLCQFSYTGTVPITVTYNGPDPISNYEINPASSVTNVTRTGKQITFSLTSPANGLSQPLEIQINNNNPQDRIGIDPTTGLTSFGAATRLYILADAPEVNPPNGPSSSIMYFGRGNDFLPGNAQTLTIDDNVLQTSMYVAPGAVLNANIIVNHRSTPFTIYGHGFIQNTLTQAQKSGLNPPQNQYALRLNSNYTQVRDINLINSIEYNFVIDGSNNIIDNVKCFHTNVNSDGISLGSYASYNQVLNSWIVDNDNQIVLAPEDKTIGPNHNLISDCVFINTNGAGHFAFPQGDGSIGPGNVITKCLVVRTAVGALICDNYHVSNAVNPILFDNITVKGGTGDFNASQYFDLEPLPKNQRTICLRNVSLPSLPTGGTPFASIASPTDWNITFDHITLNQTLLQSDAGLGVITGEINSQGIFTSYITSNTSQPGHLIAKPGNASVALSWTASPRATSYNIYRSTLSGTGYVAIDISASPNYTDNSVVNGTTYYYTVTAVNGGGESIKATEAKATPLSTIALAPYNLTATSGNNQVVLNWHASTGATGYIVERSSTLGSGYSVLTGSAINGTTYTDTTAVNGTLYYYVVIAVNSSGQSTYSNEAPPIPPVPINPTAVINKGVLTLSWTASSGATSYNISRSTTSGSHYQPISALLNVTGTLFTDTAAANGVVYYYVINASNAGGTSNNSMEVMATIPPVNSSTAIPTDSPTMPQWGLCVMAVLLLCTVLTKISGKVTMPLSSKTIDQSLRFTRWTGDDVGFRQPYHFAHVIMVILQSFYLVAGLVLFSLGANYAIVEIRDLQRRICSYLTPCDT